MNDYRILLKSKAEEEWIQADEFDIDDSFEGMVVFKSDKTPVALYNRSEVIRILVEIPGVDHASPLLDSDAGAF